MITESTEGLKAAREVLESEIWREIEAGGMGGVPVDAIDIFEAAVRAEQAEELEGLVWFRRYRALHAALAPLHSFWPAVLRADKMAHYAEDDPISIPSLTYAQCKAIGAALTPATDPPSSQQITIGETTT